MLVEIFVTKFEVDLTIRYKVMTLLMQRRYVILLVTLTIDLVTLNGDETGPLLFVCYTQTIDLSSIILCVYIKQN